MQQVQSSEEVTTQRARAKALLVLGMHRSGTSALARVCNLLGARLGADLLPPAADNLAGFWEQREIHDIHEELLREFGSSWFDHRSMPAGWFLTEQAAHYQQQIVEVLRRDFTGAPLWAVKDPRMCRLIPFWVPIIGTMGATPVFLLLARNPLEVALSLEKRDKFAPVQGLLIWLRHMLDAERDTRDFPRAFITYDSLVADWRQAVAQVEERLGIDVGAEMTRRAAEIDQFLSRDHRHQQVDDKELAAHPLVTGWARETYETFKHMCATPSEKWCREFDRIGREVAKAEQLYGHWLTHERSEVAAHGVRIDGLAAELSAARKDLAERESRIELLGRELDEVRVTMAQRETRLDGLTADLRAARVQIGERNTRLEVTAGEVAGLRRELEVRETRVEALSAEVAGLRRELEVRETRIEGLSGEVRSVRAKLVRRTARVEELTGEARGALARDSEQQTKIEETAARVTAAETKVAEYEVRLNELTRELGEQKAELKSRQEQMESAMGKQAAQAQRIEELSDLLYRARRDQGTLLATARRILPSKKFMFCIDSPIGRRIAKSEFSLVGWCFRMRSAQKVQSIRARVGKKSFSGVCGLPRPDVAEVHAGCALVEALKLSGFQIQMILKPGQYRIALEALDAEGRWGLVGKRHVIVLPKGISEAILAETEPSTTELEEQREQARGLSYRPLISVVTAVYNTPPRVLREMIQSVLAQTYDKWELCLADGNSDKPGVREVLNEFKKADHRIRLRFLERNQGIANNTNAALGLARGEFIALLDHDDLLAPFALFEVVKALGTNPTLDMIYSDEDKIDGAGNRYRAFFKPDWSPDLLFSFMYTGHLSVYRKKLVDEIGGFRSECDFSQDYDLALRAVERTTGIAHVPKILYHWRSIPGSAAAGDKPYARVTNLKALADSVQRRAYKAEVLEYSFANRIRYHVVGNALVSIIVPSDSEANITACLRALLQRTRYARYEILLVTNSALIQRLKPRYADDSRIRFVPFDRPFNFSAKCNLGASASAGEHVLFLNDDVAPMEDGWLEAMLGLFQRPEVGAVSPKLVYADGKIQHAGLVTGVRGLVGTAFHQEAADCTDYFNLAISMRNTSVLSAACLLMPKALFETIGGFDAENTPNMHSDVDLCFRIREKGYLLVYTPFATLRHIGHASLGMVEKKDGAPDKAGIYLLKRWGGYTSTDPYFTENMRDVLYKDSPTKYRMVATNNCGLRRTRGDILMVSHDLSLSGAPIILSWLTAFLCDAGYFVTVVSPRNGPLLKYYEEHKIPVVIDPLILKTPAVAKPLLKDFDLIVSNTILGAQVVHTAKSLRKPCLWLVHESQFGVQMAAEDPSVSSALGLADAVVFVSDQTRQLYQKFCRGNAHLTVHLGLSLPSQAPRPAFAKSRSKLIVVHLGSIEPRKGQDLLLKSIAALPPQIAEDCEFYLLGRILDHQFFAGLQKAAQGWNQVHFLGEKSHEEALSYIQAADVIVCPSRDDPSPVFVLEAMACGKAIISAAVGAIPEIIQHEVSGLIVPVEAPDAMAQQLARLWKDRSLIERLGRNAQVKFRQDLTIERYGREVVEILQRIAPVLASQDKLQKRI